MQQQELVLTQESENSPANFVMIHVPKREIFMSILHPAASLFEEVTDENDIHQSFLYLKEIFKKKGIEVQTLEKALSKNRQKLEDFAFRSLKYIDITPKEETKTSNEEADKKFEYYTSEKYKHEVISKMNEKQLIDVIFTQPTIKLKKTLTNTFIENHGISFSPLSNLVFCRDQQITTKKGIVFCRMKSKQRAFETEIMQQAYKNINARIIGRVPEGAFLEGGDFFVAKPDLALCGVGVRTTIEGVNYLMENDLLGTERFGIVYDETDLDQQRMHLDTFFNILNDKWVVALDFEECSKLYRKKVQRRVFLFSKKGEKITSDRSNVKDEVGDYKLVRIFEDFDEYIKYEGYNVIKISNQEQIDYMINFLNIGNNCIICCNRNLKEKVKESGAEVIFVEFSPVQKMYGALHCATQVGRFNNEK